MWTVVLPFLLSVCFVFICCSRRKAVTSKEQKRKAPRTKTRTRSSATSGSRTKTPGGRSRTPIEDPGSAPLISALQSNDSPIATSPKEEQKAKTPKKEDQNPSPINTKFKSIVQEAKEDDKIGKKKGSELKEVKTEGKRRAKDKKSHQSSETIPYVPQAQEEGLHQKQLLVKSVTCLQDDTALRNTSLIQTVTVEEEPPMETKPTARTPVGKKATTPPKDSPDEKTKFRRNRQPPTAPLDENPTEESSLGPLPTPVFLKKTQASDDEGKKKTDEKRKKTVIEGKKKPQKKSAERN